MKIDLTKKQYEDLLTAVGISGELLTTLAEETMGGELRYGDRADRMEDLERHLISFADDFGVQDITGGEEDLMDDEYFETVILPVVDAYEKNSTFAVLSGELGRRDFMRSYTEAELDEFAEKNDGYFGKEMDPYEEKYRAEFARHGLSRLHVKDDGEAPDDATPSPYL